MRPSGTSDRRFEQRVGGDDLPRDPETEPRKGAFRRTGSKAVRRGAEVAGQERRTWRGGSERSSRYRRAKGRREAPASPEIVPRMSGAMIRNGIRTVAGSKGWTCRRLTVPCSGRACRLANELLAWVTWNHFFFLTPYLASALPVPADARRPISASWPSA